MTGVSLAVLLSANRLGADNDGPVRFHEVSSWRGSFIASAHQYTTDELAGRGTQTIYYESSIIVDFLLDEFEDEPAVWRGRLINPRMAADYRGVKKLVISEEGSTLLQEETFSASGSPPFDPGAQAELKFHRERGWSFHFPTPYLKAELTEKMVLTPTKGPVVRQQTQRQVSPSAESGTATFPYPANGLILFAGDKKSEHHRSVPGEMAGGIVWEYTVYLEPASMEELRLEIEEPADYATWRPETTPQRDRGTPMEVTARLVTATGGKPNTQVASFEWELKATSKERGVALNFPLDANDTKFDLELDASGQYFVLSKENQRMVRVVQTGWSDKVKVVPFDWGGWSTLQVTAILTDGRRIPGKLKGQSEDGLRVPKRAPESHIADGWKNASGASGADKDDDEKIEGQKDNGDGFTLYEEYRGWVENGKHLAGDPKGKDFFVLNLIGADAEPGIALFKGISQLTVHSKLRADEMSEEKRVMNGNHREGAHLDQDQHGVWVKTFGSKSDLGDEGAMTTMLEKGVAGRPGITKGVGILARDNTESTFNKPFNLPPGGVTMAFDRAIAHELLHSVGVEHHGKGDYKMDLFFIAKEHPGNRLGKSYYALSLARKEPIRVLNEAGQEVAADPNTAIIIQAFHNSYYANYLAAAQKQYAIDLSTAVGKSDYASPEAMAEERLYDSMALTFGWNGAMVGVEHGPHSGDQDCLLRYYFANFYEVKDAGERTLYSVTKGTDVIGNTICRSRQGTGINDAGRKPHSRYGDAAADAGNCFEQICPNDSIPPRAAKE